MTTSQKKIFLGGSATGVGLAFLYMAVNQLQIGIKDVREFSFCVAGLLGLLCASAFGLTGLCGILFGTILLTRPRK